MPIASRTVRHVIAAFGALTFGALVQAQLVDPTALRTEQLLADGWRFLQSDELTDEAALAATGSDWQVVTLPHTWNAEDAATPNFERYERGVGWYRLELMRPAAGARHWLEIGAASLVADVWLNGSKLGEHDGGYTAFRFDVTDELLAGVANVLLVKVDNSIPQENDDDTAIAPLGGDYNKSGGLYRYVSLISTPDAAHFDLGDFGGPGVYASSTIADLGGPGVYVSSTIAAGSAEVSVRARVTNDAATPGDLVVRVALTDAGGVPAATAEQSAAVAAGATNEIKLALALANPHLWHGKADPYLYKLVADLVRGDGTVVDRVVQSFGIREMRFDVEQGFYLNGQHVGRLNGVAMHQDFAGKGYAVSDADVEQSLALIVEIGASAVRLGHYPFSAYTLNRLDELGLVAWAERPSGIRTTVDTCERIDITPEATANVRQQLVETIRQQYNHAAIALWSIGNETSFGQVGCDRPYDNVTPLLRELHALAKTEDPTRPTAYAEFPHPVDREGPYATEGITDLFATNRYFLWYHEPIEAFSPLLDDLHELAAGQPLAVSEYGGGSAIAHHTDDPEGGVPEVHSADDDATSSYQPEQYASFLHEQNYRVISSKPYLWASFLWNMFDFGSTNRNEGGVLGINTKGLVTFDRQTRKDPFFFYKANWSSEPVTYITSRRYTDRAYAVADVKVYSNADSVDLSVNGTPVGSLTSDRCEQKTCVFEAVRLAQGENSVVATGNHAGTAVVDTVTWSLATTDVNIAAGRLQTGYESGGVRFGSDTFYEGGTADHVGEGDGEGGTPDLTGADDPQLYKYFRRGEFSYAIPLADGNYSVTLGFIEPNEDAEEGSRVFSVSADGRPLLEDFDVRRDAGAPQTSVTKMFAVPVSGGRLVLAFAPTAGEAIVSNIRISSQ